MTKTEYLEQLKGELLKNNVPDADEIVLEYEQHFAFKLADGFSEEEIAAKLGTPGEIAAQFQGAEKTGKKKRGIKAVLITGLTLLGVIEGAAYIAFFAFAVVLFAAAVTSAAAGVMLMARLNIAGLLPSMPYAGALLLGVCMIALGVLFCVAGVYSFSSLRQLVRASLRWRKNTLGGALPNLPSSPQFSPKTRRTLRTVLLFATVVFGVAFIAGFAVLAIQAGSFGFWHVFGWFVR